MTPTEVRQTHVRLASDFLLEYTPDKNGLITLTTTDLDTFEHSNEKVLGNFKKKDWWYKYSCLVEAANDMDVKIKFVGLPEVKLKDLTKKYTGQFIQLEECNISSISPNRPIVLNTTYVCTGCGKELAAPPKRGDKECCSINNYIESPRPEDIVDAQWIRVQETQRDTKQSKIPIAIPILMKGEENLWQVAFNDRIKPKGVLRYRLSKNKIGDKEMVPWFEMLEFDRTSGMDEDITYDDTFREYIKLEMKKPGYWNKVIKSFCPWIYGQEVMKEVVLLGIGSMKTDMPLRILIIGDPSTGKSDVLKAGNMLPAQKHFSVMKNDRGTGLTVTSVKDPLTEEWTAEGGGFARAHGWTLIIDEFQAGHEQDIDGLNSVIWDHKIPYNLAGGVHGEFDANCALIIACNPQGGRMAKEENIFELLKFVGEKTLPAFISRMSFILFLEENNDLYFQRKIAESIYENWSDEMKKKHFWEDWWAETKTVKQSTTVMRVLDMEPVDKTIYVRNESSHRYGIKTLQKIVRYITEEVHLTALPPDLKEKFVNYYVDKRGNIGERTNKIVTPRYMVHLLGMAQNKARWNGRGAPSEQDMEYAFELMYNHMTLAATDPKTGEIDAGQLNGNMPESRMKEIEIEKIKKSGRGKQIDWACKKAGALHDDEYFTITELKGFLEQLGMDNKWNDSELLKWLNDGLSYGSLKKNGEKYKWTPLEGRL